MMDAPAFGFGNKQQGYLPLIYLRDYLHKDKIVAHQDTGNQISIICSQNL